MNGEVTEIVSAALKASVGHKLGQAGAGGAVIFGLSINELGVVAGMAMAICGFAMNWYYRRKEYRLKELYYKKHGISDDSERAGLRDE